ncbi:hypothetical protein ACTWPB_25845 [Nocardia sp. IBHARD005]|uniref:hypothetical protein n=1 Tax=Nocardia sp. IBHARD005 TaxID=3457765 RepID=UPI004057CC1A
MNHAEHDESIGSMLASIATALREVSDKLDIVAARVQFDVPTFPIDEDLPDHTRIRRLESWAFRASQDISRLSSRLDALDNDGEPDSGRPARGSRSRREVREAAEAAERAADGLDDHLSAADPSAPHQNIDGSRPPLERRNSPTRPTTDHLGDPTALAATPIARSASGEAVAPLGRSISFDSDSVVAAGSDGAGDELPTPSRRPAPTRLGATALSGSTGAASGERVATAGDATSTNGINGTGHGVAADIAARRNGTPVPAVIGTVLTAPAGDHTSGTSAPISTKSTAATLAEDRAPTSGLDGTDNGTTSAAASATLPGSAEVGDVVRAGGVNGFSSSAMKRVPETPVEAQSARTSAGARDPLTAETSPDAVIERARPAKKPTDSAGTGGGRLSAPSPDELASNGNGVARSAAANPTHAANDHLASGFTAGDRTATAPNGKPVNGFDAHTPEFPPRSDASADARTTGNTANGIHWSFTEDPAPTPTAPDRNGHARNGFTTDSARRSDSLFDDFTPRDRLTTGEIPEPPTAPGAPARLTPPTELTTQRNHVPVDPTRIADSSPVNGAPDISDSPAYSNRPSSIDRPANTSGLPDHNGLPNHTPLTNHTALTNHDRPDDDGSDPPTLGLPTGRGMSTRIPDPLERPVADPIPPSATDSAGITVTGTYRAFDIERAHVDKLQAMLDELKRSAGLPPGRRDVFGPPTPELG